MILQWTQLRLMDSLDTNWNWINRSFTVKQNLSLFPAVRAQEVHCRQAGGTETIGHTVAHISTQGQRYFEYPLSASE